MAASTVIAILGLLWTLFQSILLLFQIWSFFSGLFMRGERVEAAKLMGFGLDGITITILLILLLPYLKPVIVLGIKAFCAIFKLKFVPIDAIEQGLNAASDLVAAGTGVAASVGKQVMGAAAGATALPQPLHVVIDNWPPAAGAVPAPPVNPPAVTVNTNPGQTITPGAAK